MDSKKLGETLEKLAQNYSQTAAAFGIMGEAGLFGVFASSAELCAQLQSCCRQLEGVLLDNLKRFMGFYRKELVPMQESAEEWRSIANQAIQVDRALKEKKELLFSQKTIKKWELSPQCPFPQAYLLQDKEVALSQMLPNDTAMSVLLQKKAHYYSHKLVSEIRYIGRKDESDFRAQFTSLAKMITGVMEKAWIAYDKYHRFASPWPILPPTWMALALQVSLHSKIVEPKVPMSPATLPQYHVRFSCIE
jgi:hypothetical protein